MANQRPLPHASRDRLLLAAILVGLLGLKLAFNPFPYSDVKTVDGAYYYQIARHVEHGDGLLTSVSTHHHGFAKLPHPIAFYPLWPVVLGMTARAIGLERAAHVVPETLYFVSLCLLYVIANRVGATFGRAGRVLWTKPVDITAGHLAVLILGLNHVFFKFTSLPFTEGLAFALMFTAMLATMRVVDDPSRRGMAVAAGLLIGSCYLARSQLLPLTIVLPGTLAILAAGGRRVYWSPALISGLVALAVVASWAAYVAVTMTPFRFVMLVDPAATHDLPAMPAEEWLKSTPTFWAYLLDRAGGIWASFTPTGRFSFIRSFGPVAYLVPLAALLAANPRTLRATLARATEPAAHPVVSTMIVGAACVGPVYLLHERFGEWFFQFRYGLPLILPIVVAVPYLMVRHQILRLVVLVCLVGSLAGSALQFQRLFREPHPPPNTALRELARWTAAQSPPPVILSTHAATLTAVTSGLFHHWLCEDPIDLVRLYFDQLHVEYLVTYPKDLRCTAFGALEPTLDRVRTFGDDPDQTLVLWQRRRREP